MQSIKKLTAYILISLLTLAVGAGCSKDEPRRAEGVTVPTGPRDEFTDQDDSSDPDKDDDSSNNETVKNAEILGSWIDSNGSTIFNFNDDDTFTGTAVTGMGFNEEAGTPVEGIYTYDSFKTRLYLSVNGRNEQYEVETVYTINFRCIVDGEKMTLYSFSGKEFILWRK